ncbi:MAG TPA: DUF3313 domain-containing protein [Candidatus Binatia bacterium]|nr:DUF3313 domain-containing protein [Candidatus Binatia bacterium]
MRRSPNATAAAMVFTLGITVMTGCPTTRQTRTVEPSGFLGDYSQLRPGGQGEAQLVYVKPGVVWARYTEVLIDPVTIWTSGDDSTVAKVPDEDRQLLADYLDASLRNSLRQDYALVDRPGPNTLRLRAAITDAKGAKVVLNTVSKVVPQLRVLTTVGGLATDTQVLVGRAGVEGELLDGLTGERLAAAVDRRAGTKALRGGASTWADVENAFDYWSDRLRTRLAELRQAT